MHDQADLFLAKSAKSAKPGDDHRNHWFNEGDLDFMAASRQDSSVRDQRRAKDEDRDREDHLHRQKRIGRDRRSRSPAPTRQSTRSDEGWKIRGRAVDEEPAQPRSLSKRIKDPRDKNGDRSPIPSSRQDTRPVTSVRSTEEPKTSRHKSAADSQKYRDSDQSRKRRRSRSHSASDQTRRIDKRKISSPEPSSRVSRGDQVYGYRKSRHPPTEVPLNNRHSTHQEKQIDSAAITLDYPSSRQRSPSLSFTNLSGSRHHRREESPRRRPRGDPPSPHSKRRARATRSSYYEDEGSARSQHRRSFNPRERSPAVPRESRYRRGSPSTHQPEKRGQRHRSPHSPEPRHRIRGGDRQDTQNSARTNQPASQENPRSSSLSRRNPGSDAHRRGTPSGPNSASMHDPYAAQRPRPPHVDTRQPYNASPQWTPTTSHHGSPHAASPYHHGRGTWTQPPPQQYYGQHAANAYSPPYQQPGYPSQHMPQGHPYPSPHPQYSPSPQHHPPAGYTSPAYPPPHHAGNFSQPPPPDHRRFSGPQPPATAPAPNATRGKDGHFQNLQWTASKAKQSNQKLEHRPSPTEDDNPFRPSKALRVEDESTKVSAPNLSSSASSGKEGSKFSFQFKNKQSSLTPSRPVTDLAQRVKEPLRREGAAETTRYKEPLSSRETLGARPRDEFRRPDPRDFRRDREYAHDPYDRRRDDRDYHESRRRDHRDDRRAERDHRKERTRPRSPEIIVEKQIRKRLKPRPMLTKDFKESKSVYYRKPGNESVVGSGTYGKVFKAIHVYTKQLVALKKIRMEGEKDGFPVTAVREIKLLQSLKHDNVVCLQEVMVEHNDCYMVFEYLSHDLTGLLNHPSFILDHAHKKHLAKQLFEGLFYLHRRGVLHRDIKAANILISSTGQLKLADFGLARFFSKRGQLDYTNRVITIWYRSPELLLGETQYGPEVDIWSAACVLIEIFTKHAIFPGDGGEINQLDKIYNVLGTPTKSQWPKLVDMTWFELLHPTERKSNTFAEKYEERVTPAAFELLTQMFHYDPTKRPSAAEVLEHEYFTKEEPAPKPAIELQSLAGDWHEFESKALRKEKERKEQEARRANRVEEQAKEREKRKAAMVASTSEREAKRLKSDDVTSADIKGSGDVVPVYQQDVNMEAEKKGRNQV